MYSQDWVDHMKAVMTQGEPGDVYEVFRVNYVEGGSYGGHGSTYVKTKAGYRHSLYEHREALIAAPFAL